jgi:hypothetical protein
MPWRKVWLEQMIAEHPQRLLTVPSQVEVHWNGKLAYDLVDQDCVSGVILDR